MAEKELWTFLKEIDKSGLTKQQKKTIKGQALAGDVQGALKGYQRLIRARQTKKKGVV